MDMQKGKSLLIFPEKYVAVDIETTGLCPYYDSIIEVGLLKIEAGEIVNSFQSLIHPEMPIPLFIGHLTGITNEMVEDAPRFEEVAEEILEFINDSILVGHNVNFDIRFLRENFLLALGKLFQNDFVDTLRISRRILKDIENHSLESLRDYFNIPLLKEEDYSHYTDGKGLLQEHRAIYDCLIANKLLLCLKEKADNEHINLEELAKRKKYDLRALKGNEELFDEDSIFFKKNCVFTGKLEKFSREEAAKIIVNIGGFCENNVTKKTNFLIVGDMDYKCGLEGHKSTKLKKAEGLIEKGQDLHIIPESAFYDFIVEQ